MKFKKILEFYVRIMTTMKIHRIAREIHKNYGNNRTPCENYENHENHKIIMRITKIIKFHLIKTNSNHENHRSL